MNKKMATPILITVISIVFQTLYAWMIFDESMEALNGIAMAYLILIELLLLFFIGVSLYVLIERINEIKGGEEDDLSKY